MEGVKEIEAIETTEAVIVDDSIRSIIQILKTTKTFLTASQMTVMFFGFLAVISNGAATPLFGFTVSQLMGNLFKPNASPQTTMYWSLGVLGVAAFDGITACFKVILL